MDMDTMEKFLKLARYGKLAVAAIGGMFCYWLGGLDQLLTALLVLMVIDYLSGIIRGAYLQELSSRIGLRGIGRKVLLLTVVAVAFIIESIIGEIFPLREIVIMFFIANEGLSILENSAAVGLPLPKKLKAALLQLKEQEQNKSKNASEKTGRP